MPGTYRLGLGSPLRRSDGGGVMEKERDGKAKGRLGLAQLPVYGIDAFLVDKPRHWPAFPRGEILDAKPASNPLITLFSGKYEVEYPAPNSEKKKCNHEPVAILPVNLPLMIGSKPPNQRANERSNARTYDPAHLTWR